MPIDYMVAGAPTHTDAPRTPDAHFVREVQKGRGGKKSISPKKLRNSGSSTANVATAPAAQMLRDDVDYFRSESLEDIEHQSWKESLRGGGRAGVQTERPRDPETHRHLSGAMTPKPAAMARAQSREDINHSAEGQAPKGYGYFGFFGFGQQPKLDASSPSSSASPSPPARRSGGSRPGSPSPMSARPPRSRPGSPSPMSVYASARRAAGGSVSPAAEAAAEKAAARAAVRAEAMRGVSPTPRTPGAASARAGVGVGDIGSRIYVCRYPAAPASTSPRARSPAALSPRTDIVYRAPMHPVSSESARRDRNGPRKPSPAGRRRKPSPAKRPPNGSPLPFNKIPLRSQRSFDDGELPGWLAAEEARAAATPSASSFQMPFVDRLSVEESA